MGLDKDLIARVRINQNNPVYAGAKSPSRCQYRSMRQRPTSNAPPSARYQLEAKVVHDLCKGLDVQETMESTVSWILWWNLLKYFFYLLDKYTLSLPGEVRFGVYFKVFEQALI